MYNRILIALFAFSILSGCTLANVQNDQPTREFRSVQTSPPENTLGASVEVKHYLPWEKNPSGDLEMSETPHHVTQLLFTGFPKGKEVTMSTRRDLLIKDYFEQSGFTILEDGQFQLKNTNVIPASMWFGSAGFLPGERIDCQFTTIDGSFYYNFSFIPHPAIVCHPSSQLKVEAELSCINATSYKLRITGMENGEKFKQISTSGDELIEAILPYSSRDVFSYMPGVIGRKGGIAKLTFKRLANNDVISLSLPWGDDLVEYLKGRLVYFPTGAKELSGTGSA